jgi:hypothetical protein
MLSCPWGRLGHLITMPGLYLLMTAVEPRLMISIEFPRECRGRRRDKRKCVEGRDKKRCGELYLPHFAFQLNTAAQ